MLLWVLDMIGNKLFYQIKTIIFKKNQENVFRLQKIVVTDQKRNIEINFLSASIFKIEHTSKFHE